VLSDIEAPSFVVSESGRGVGVDDIYKKKLSTDRLLSDSIGQGWVLDGDGLGGQQCSINDNASIVISHVFVSSSGPQLAVRVSK
jgi:hypothetical protein